MKYYRLIFFIICFNIHAMDEDQTFSKCGIYEVAAKLKCEKINQCTLVFNEKALSNKEIKLISSKFSLDYFHNTHIKAKIKVISTGKSVNGKILTPPIQQIKTIKKTFSKLITPEVCQ